MNLLIEVVRGGVAPVNDDSVGVVRGVVAAIVVDDDLPVLIVDLICLIRVCSLIDFTKFELCIVELPSRPASNLAIVPKAKARLVLCLADVCSPLNHNVIKLLVDLVAEVGRDVSTAACKIIFIARPALAPSLNFIF